MFHEVHEKDSLLTSNLRKAPKLNPKTLHPGNNKQNVPLALNIFHETTAAGILSYFPAETAASGFLKLINSWWTISNSKTSIDTHNRLGNAAVRGDKKPEFLREFATWLEKWRDMRIPGCDKFTLTPQTFDALIVTLRGTAALIEDLFEDEEYAFILTARLQTDPLERNFGKVRQMSGGRFLIGLREFMSSEKILCMKSLLKADINCWDERVKSKIADEFANDLLRELNCIANDFQENSLCADSREVAVNIAGYVMKQLMSKFDCKDCKKMLKQNPISSQYLDILNRGGLTKPNASLAEYVCSCFAILDTAHDILFRYSHVITVAAMKTIDTYQTDEVSFLCQTHRECGRKSINRIVTNIYFNNEQKLKTAQVRKDQVVDFKARQRKKMKTS